MPVDPVPDFIPVLGHADDAIAVAAVLRLVGPPFAQDRWSSDRCRPGCPSNTSSKGREDTRESRCRHDATRSTTQDRTAPLSRTMPRTSRAVRWTPRIQGAMGSSSRTAANRSRATAVSPTSAAATPAFHGSRRCPRLTG
ncbi:DUF1232 domain-containing protein [Nocardiopsis sp. EMB25]|uniref:DUF1232 domain-containing protein n=1 Tax=Nocardiopsis sp. EMB25 TaxID=2835867 RepID=UPI003FA361C0